MCSDTKRKKVDVGLSLAKLHKYTQCISIRCWTVAYNNMYIHNLFMIVSFTKFCTLHLPYGTLLYTYNYILIILCTVPYNIYRDLQHSNVNELHEA